MPRVNITKDHWDKYRVAPGTCPFCGGSVDAGQHDFEGTEAWQHVSCSDCGAEWVEWFKMTGITEREDR